MNNEIVSFGGRPVTFGALGSVGLLGEGDVADLLAYRSEWEPFIKAHLDLWREVNAILEDTQIGREICPNGFFDPTKLPRDNPAAALLCADLLISRIRIDPVNPAGILAQWNVWKDRSAAEITFGAASMLEFHQSTVLRVGGPMKDELVRIGKQWKIPIQLPDLPTFSVQQGIITRIQSAFIATKGILQVIGYTAGETLAVAGDVGLAVAKGLSDTAAAVPKAVSATMIAGIVAVVVVAGGLIVYYVPRRRPEAA